MRNDDQFGSIIKQGRADRGLTQELLAELVEVDLRTIQRWEAEECLPWPVYIERMVSILPEIEASLQKAIKKKHFTPSQICEGVRNSPSELLQN